MTRTRRSPRPGFTMIELLVVIGIIIVLASMLILISPRFAEDQRTTRGADHVQGWMFVAKQRAYRDQQPRGVRLVLGANNQVSELIYIERPEDLRGEPDPNYTGLPFDPGDTNHNHIQVPFQNSNANVFIANWDLQTGDLVMRGDFFKLNTYETQPYNIHRIESVQFPVLANLPNSGKQVQGTLLTLRAEDGTPSNVVPGGSIPLDADTRYQIIRQARPLTGEPPLAMPRDVVVDLGIDPATTQSRSVLPGLGLPDQLDILFSQRGQVMGGNANGGKIILRVRQGDKPDNYGEQIYIVIHTRTGLITAHPVNLTDPLDPFKFTRDAKDSGM